MQLLLLQAECEEEELLDDALHRLLELLEGRGVDAALRDVHEQPSFRARCQHSVVSAGVGDVLVDVPSLHLLGHAGFTHHQDLGDVLGVLLQVVQQGLLLGLQVGSTQLLVDPAKSLICCMGSVPGPKTMTGARRKALQLALGPRATGGQRDVTSNKSVAYQL